MPETELSQSRESEDSEPLLLRNYEVIRSMPDIEPARGDFRELFATKEQRQHYFDAAREAFQTYFDPAETRRRLDGSSKGNLKYLKKTRRLGLILKANYNFFDQGHRAPQQLRDFLRLLGRHNDHYFNGREEQAAALLRGSQIEDIENMELNLKVVGDEDFKSFLKSIIEKVLANFSNPALNTREFHHLRKQLRLCADLFQIPAAENPGGKEHWLFTSILGLAVELGEVHDRQVEDVINGKPESEIQVSVMPAVKEKFLDLLPYISKAAGIELAAI